MTSLEFVCKSCKKVNSLDLGDDVSMKGNAYRIYGGSFEKNMDDITVGFKLAAVGGPEEIPEKAQRDYERQQAIDRMIQPGIEHLDKDRIEQNRRLIGTRGREKREC
jgi:hypothetical protein